MTKASPARRHRRALAAKTKAISEGMEESVLSDQQLLAAEYEELQRPPDAASERKATSVKLKRALSARLTISDALSDKYLGRALNNTEQAMFSGALDLLLALDTGDNHPLLDIWLGKRKRHRPSDPRLRRCREWAAWGAVALSEQTGVVGESNATIAVLATKSGAFDAPVSDSSVSGWIGALPTGMSMSAKTYGKKHSPDEICEHVKTNLQNNGAVLHIT